MEFTNVAQPIAALSMGQAALPPENLFGHTKKLRFILAALERLEKEKDRYPLRVLDYGCGNGTAVSRFLCRAGYEVLGVDVHRDSVAYANHYFGSSSCSFEAGDWSHVAASGERFDAILFADVLEHVDNPSELLRGACRVLSPGGRVLVSVPNGFGPFEIESYISRLPVIGPLTLRLTRTPALLAKKLLAWAGRKADSGDAVPYNEESGHLQFFSRQKILQLCKEAHLIVCRFERLSFICGPYSNSLLARSQAFCRLNTRIADRLPIWMVSAWFLELRKAEG